MKLSLQVFGKSFFFILAASIAGLAVHLVLLFFEPNIVEELPKKQNLFHKAFSYPMLPLLLLEIIYSALILFFWYRMKKTVQRAYDIDLKEQKMQSKIRTTQKMTALIAEYISKHNSEIMNHLEFRKSKGQQVSDKLVNASNRIARSIQILSEIGFIQPYIDSESEYDPVELLEKKLEDLSENDK